MHYRLYKIAIQDCLSIMEILMKDKITLSNRLWIKGILNDMIQAFSQCDTIPDSLVQITNQIDTIEYSRLTDSLRNLIAFLHSNIHVKVRIDIFLARPVSVTYLMPIYHYLLKYNFFDVRLIATDFYPQNIYNSSGQYLQLIEYLKSRNIDYIAYDQYNPFNELPDILFYSFHNHIFMKPLSFQHSTIAPLVDRTMFLEYSLSPNDLLFYDSHYTVTPFTWLQFRTSEFSKNAISWGAQDIVTGHPLLDLSCNMYSGRTEVTIPDEWKVKFEGKTVVLWSINPQTNLDVSINMVQTYKRIKDTVDIITNINNKFGTTLTFILRPHPLCFLPEFQPFFSELGDNIVLDLNPDSFPALHRADVFIGDAGSLYAQFLPSERPALIFNNTHRETNFVFWTQTNTSSNLNDAYPFIEHVLQDYSSCRRPITEIDRYCLGEMDGQSSKRISEAIIQKFVTEERSFIQQSCPSLHVMMNAAALN